MKQEAGWIDRGQIFSFVPYIMRNNWRILGFTNITLENEQRTDISEETESGKSR